MSDLPTQDRLLSAAYAVFAEKGFRDATVAEICKQAHANIAAVNYHFGDKESLYNACWRHGFALAMEAMPLDEGVDATSSPQDRLRAFIHAFMRRVSDETEIGYFPRLMVKEMAEPTGALDSETGILVLEALERRPGEQLLASLETLVSSGASVSTETREGLLRHQPDMILLDTLGSTESSGYALSTPEAGVFAPLPGTRVLDENLQDVEPGSDTIAMVYGGGYQPIGYYKSPEKSAETFVEIEGQRYVMTGDRCTVRADGNLVLLGRDSTVVNTGGEKVYTVEVERVLVDFPAITDALVVGLPHPRFGKMVVSVVQGPGLNGNNLDVAAIKAHAAQHLADYKIPREIYAIDSLQRAPNGKPDYSFVTDYALECSTRHKAQSAAEKPA